MAKRNSPTIGVLALQGAFSKHITMLAKLDVHAKQVRTAKQLEDCDGLIIPGGESTVMARHIDNHGLRIPLKKFVQEKPVFGTCAGMILLAKDVLCGTVKSLGALDIAVERNAFGRQVESFSMPIQVKCRPRSQSFRSIFIRAPRIRRWGAEVTILAEFNGEPVLVQQNKCLAAAFHPELANDPLIHKHFLDLVKAKI